MTRLGWQVREQGSGRFIHQRVTVSGSVWVDDVDGVVPRTEPLRAVMEHDASCTVCALRTDGGMCQQAARLVREERESRR